MNLTSYLTPLNLCGIYELDSAGKITYYKMNLTYDNSEQETNLTGSNFFEVAGFENIEAFKRHVVHFFQSSDSVADFNFDCRFPAGEPASVKVRLIRVSEREFEANSKKVIVDIRKS